MPGFVSDVYQRVFDADVLVLPSHSEGMPNVVAEAYALRTPTVLSDIPAHRWLSEGGKNSLLFDPAQPRELTEALTRMARDGELRASLTANGQRCADDLSTAKLAERYAAYYRSVLARQRR
jgi:glycosyltransferase involved in cell wall biosynthesis